MRNLQRSVRLEVARLQHFAENALAICLRQKKASALTKFSEINVLLISNRRMAALHRQFLQTKGSTDVITFQHGEIFISAEMARKNATRFGTTLQRELHLYVVHGLLHLDGFDDATAADSKKMRAKQEKIVAAAINSSRQAG